MSDSKGMSGPQFRADQPQEQEAVRTTIVGGRPPGSGQQLGPIPRGVEVLVKKASVDAEFREVLLAERAKAADRIGLKLDPAEALMLSAVPADQLEAIIARTHVPKDHRRVFLGTAAAAMLAAVGLFGATCVVAPRGIAPDDPNVDEEGRPKRNIMGETGGCAPDDIPPELLPDRAPPPAENGGEEDTDEAPSQPSDLPPVTFGVRPGMAPAGVRPESPGSSPGAAPGGVE